jgi:phospholipid/cholesterol/gamma-HCH transport system substrate-binding protein
MKRNVIETVLGAVVIVTAVVFLAFSYSAANVGSVGGYEVTANFSGIGGLSVGDDVEISGVRVGDVAKVDLDPGTYLARVTINVDPSVKLPEDTAALISSKSLLGGRYLSLEPGAAEEIIPPGGHIQYTQAPQNLEQLLGQFIFSMNGSDKNKEAAAAAAPEPVSAPAPAPAAVESTPAENPVISPAEATPAPVEAPAPSEQAPVSAEPVPAETEAHP